MFAVAAGASVLGLVAESGRGRTTCGVDLIRLVAHDNDGNIREISRLVDLIKQVVDILERIWSEEVIDQNVGIGVTETVSLKRQETDMLMRSIIHMLVKPSRIRRACLHNNKTHFLDKLWAPKRHQMFAYIHPKVPNNVCFPVHLDYRLLHHSSV